MTIIRGHEIAGRMPLFQEWGRRAIWAGDKTQTRRVLKHFGTEDHYDIPLCEWGLSEPSPIQWDGEKKLWNWEGSKLPAIGDWFWRLQSAVDDTNDCPVPIHIKVGDIRVMTEPLKIDWDDDLDKGWAASYTDDGAAVISDFTGTRLEWRWGREYLRSIHMPHEAARALCEITGVRIEWLQAISEEDAKAEGVNGGCCNCGNDDPCGCGNPLPDHRDAFIYVWDSINGKKYPWPSNPFVIVYDFKVVA